MATETDMAYDEQDEDREEGAAWRRTLPWVILAIVVAIVAWLIWAYGGWRDNGSQTASTDVKTLVTVPDLIGVDGEDAERLLDSIGLETETFVSYDALGEPGTVSDQSPDSGVQVRQGTTVQIWVIDPSAGASDEDSTQPDYAGEAKGMTSRPGRVLQMVTVPDVVGLSEADAIARVEALGFLARPMYQPRAWGEYRVEQQKPGAGDSAEYGFQVHLYITIPPPPSPPIETE